MAQPHLASRSAAKLTVPAALRERLKEAKGIGTPATRAEIIRGLKTQEFLPISGKNIVPTERGLPLFGVLERADPALVDPGVTAQLECLLDDDLFGRQKMMEPIDAVCAVAARIIHKLTVIAEIGAAPLCAPVSEPAGGLPPTPAMQRFVDSLAKQKNIKPPRGYTKSGSVCRSFLDQHAPQQGGRGAFGEVSAGLVKPAQINRTPKSARGSVAEVPTETNYR